MDKYGQALYPYLTNDKSTSSKPSRIPFGFSIPQSVAEYIALIRGETPNHREQRLALWAARNFPAVRHLILEWYGPYMASVGMDATGGSDEALFSTSHWGHFGAARGPLLYFAMREGDREVVDCMVRVWRQMMAAAKLLRTPDWWIVSPGARFLGNANQMKECNRTFRWLATGTIDKVPDNLDSSPSYLGLYSMVLIAQARIRREDWASNWYAILGTMNEDDADLPPLKNPLVVRKSPSGHVAEFLSTDKMLMPAKWAYANYRTREILYGLDHSTLERVRRETRPGAQFPPKGIDVRVNAKAPECPVRDGETVKEYRFPVAGKGTIN